MIRPSKLFSLSLALPMVALLATPADAHRRWLLPSQTVLSGEKETVSVDAAASNGLFYADHAALGLDGLKVVGPDGTDVTPTIIGKGRYRSAFDVALDKPGTYRIALINNGVMGSYMLNGERKRYRGTAEKAKTDIPAGATEIQLAEIAGRTETFVTLQAPNDTALKPTGTGLELVPVTHPNDFVVGEAAKFRFLIDGKPAANLKVEWVKGESRYRDKQDDKELTTGADGSFEVTANEPGYYYLEAGVGAPMGPPPGAGAGGPGAGKPREGAGAPPAPRPVPAGPPQRRATYTAVLEVLPQ